MTRETKPSMMSESATWDGATGLAGGTAFGSALAKLAAGRDLDAAAFAAATGCERATIDRVYAGAERVTTAVLARFARVLRLRAIEFMQAVDLLSLEVYALGLDPLYFVPAGQVRHDARIYMREINPRHRVPERDMLGRNPTLKALSADAVLDDLGRLEVELTYLLRAAVQNTGGTL